MPRGSRELLKKDLQRPSETHADPIDCGRPRATAPAGSPLRGSFTISRRPHADFIEWTRHSWLSIETCMYFVSRASCQFLYSVTHFACVILWDPHGLPRGSRELLKDLQRPSETHADPIELHTQNVQIFIGTRISLPAAILCSATWGACVIL